jgi:hypothetical protein
MAGRHRGTLGLVPRLELLEPTPGGIHLLSLTMAPSLVEPKRKPLLLTNPAAAHRAQERTVETVSPLQMDQTSKSAPPPPWNPMLEKQCLLSERKHRKLISSQNHSPAVAIRRTTTQRGLGNGQ